jgi:restriction system protein
VRLIESLEWKRFEDLCAGYFEAKGHKVTMTGVGGDGGVDFYLHGEADPSKPLAVAQCKAWNKIPVGVKPIRELLGVMTDAGAPLGIFLTTTSYTDEARRFAEGKHIKLLDAHRLLELVKSLPEDAQADLLDRVTEGDYTTPSCPRCGSKLVLRTATKGTGKGQQFWGCKNFPRGCRYSMPVRATARRA